MQREAWTLTFVDSHKENSVPPRSRVNALLKHALRWLGLRCVADIPLRRQVIEECCRALCPECDEGRPVARDPLGVWCHNKRVTQCQAHQLREALYQQQRRATHVGPTDSASMPPLPGAAERSGPGPA